MAHIPFEELNPRIYVEVGGTITLGINVGAAKGTVGLSIDVPENTSIDDFHEEVYEHLLDILDSQMTETTKFING